MLDVVAKCSLNWNIYMVTSIVILITQMFTIKMRSSNIINKSDAQKHYPNLVLDGIS